MPVRDRPMGPDLAVGDILKALNARIATAQAELGRVQAKATADIAELQGQIALSQRAKAALSTDKESWVLDLVTAGVL